jgi:hypothetical protein
VAGVWLIHLAVASAAAFPLWTFLKRVLDRLPGGDVLREGIRFGALFDLAELRPGLVGLVVAVGVAVAACGLLVGAAVSGGVLEALRGDDARPLAHRFGRGAGRFFGRFVSLGLIVGLGFSALGLAGVVPFVALTRAYFREGTGVGPVGPLGVLLVTVLVSVVASMVLDAARIHVVRTDGRVRGGLWAGLVSVARRPVTWLGTWLVNAALTAAVLGVYLFIRGAVATDTMALVLAMVVWQQAFALTRTGLRVALLGSEMALVEGEAASRPGPAQPEVDSSSS